MFRSVLDPFSAMIPSCVPGCWCGRTAASLFLSLSGLPRAILQALATAFAPGGAMIRRSRWRETREGGTGRDARDHREVPEVPREFIEVDAATGAVLRHHDEVKAKPGEDFLGARLRELDQEKARREAYRRAGARAGEERSRGEFEKLFRKVKEESGSGKPAQRPVRDVDLDVTCTATVTTPRFFRQRAWSLRSGRWAWASVDGSSRQHSSHRGCCTFCRQCRPRAQPQRACAG